MIKRHLLRHPLLPKVVCDKTIAPESLVYESYEEIHAASIKEMLEYCRSIDQPRLFRYFWSNWYRSSFGNVGSLWEISLSGRPRSSDTTIALGKPREKPSIYEDFVHLWRKCADVIDDSVINDRDSLYHTNKNQWV
ncbi:hypothetical protein V1515DRAFT_5249 [Lipomyces mesembrius]